MAWPTSRLTTYTAASPVKSVDLNAIQDELINLRNVGSHGDRVLNLSPWAIIGTSVLRTSSPGVAARLNTGSHLALPFGEGDRIKSIAIAKKGNAAASLVMNLYKTTAASVDTLLINGDTHVPAAAWADRALDPADTLLAAGEFLSMDFSPTVADVIFIGGIRITWDRP